MSKRKPKPGENPRQKAAAAAARRLKEARPDLDVEVKEKGSTDDG